MWVTPGHPLATLRRLAYVKSLTAPPTGASGCFQTPPPAPFKLAEKLERVSEATPLKERKVSEETDKK